MLGTEISEFSDNRYEIRAYLCYLFNRNVKNYLPHIELSQILAGIEKIKREVSIFNALYVLDASGVQVVDTISNINGYEWGKGENFNNRAYFYRAVNEKKCILTDPYPSLIEGIVVVTAAYPVYDESKKLQYVVCVDLPLEETKRLIRPNPLNALFAKTSKIVYGTLCVSLMFVTFLLFLKGMVSLVSAIEHFEKLDIKEMFEATILLTLSLAIFDLVKAIFEEEVVGRYKERGAFQIHKTMIRFLGSIIIAISIEALMLVFKFTIIEPDKILYAVYLIGGVMMLLIGLSLYIKFASAAEKESRSC